MAHQGLSVKISKTNHKIHRKEMSKRGVSNLEKFEEIEGLEPDHKVDVDLILYDIDNYEEKKVSINEIEDVVKKFRENDEVLWLNIDDHYDEYTVQKICNLFDIHTLVQEDIILKGQRPKIEDYEDYVFAVAKMIYYKDEKLIMEQVSFIVGKNYLLTFGEQIGDVFDDVRRRLRKKGSGLRRYKIDYLLYNLLDAIIDGYFQTLEVIGEEIDFLEVDILKESSDVNQLKIRMVKKNLLYIHKHTWPLRDVVSWLSKEDSEFLGKSTTRYFGDLNNQLVQVIDTTDTYREILSGLMELTLANISYRLNEVMKVLTIISTIFIPLTFIAGLYGMNFKYMPELYVEWGYPVVLISMGLITMGMIYYFKKKKWF